VEPSACHTENSAVVNTASGKRIGYGALVDEAAKMPVPASPKRKDAKEYKYVGKATKRIDSRIKVNGVAPFGIDVRQPKMMHAVVARCPVFGGTVKSFDGTKAKAVRGVKSVVQVSTGVAVVADNTWSAMEGRNALQITWDEGANAKNSSDAIHKLYLGRMEQTGVIARKDGDADAAMPGAAKKVEAVYEVPFLAHATMEPMNCTADVRADGCDIYAPTQFQTFAQINGAKITGLKPEQVRVHTTYLGGGFGRRAGTFEGCGCTSTSDVVARRRYAARLLQAGGDGEVVGGAGRQGRASGVEVADCGPLDHVAVFPRLGEERAG
jgi:isoquinoline 1-oxidoreductase beta subunit